jgi:putative oxidoreductase
MRFVVPVGRVLFSLIFVVAARRHFTQEGIQHASSLGVPLAGFAVPLSGVMATLGGISIAIGYKARWGAWLLVAFLLPVTFMMHAYWTIADPSAAKVQQAWETNVAMNVQVFEGGHAAFFEDPDRFEQELRSFLSSVATPESSR